MTEEKNQQEERIEKLEKLVEKQETQIERCSLAVELLLAGHEKQAYKALQGYDLGDFEY